MNKWLSRLITITITIFALCVNVYSAQMECVPAFLPATALTVSGGLTPSVTGGWIDVGKSGGDFSLIAINGGASTSITITYQLGYIKEADVSNGTITAITPEDGGDVVGLTAVDINAGSKHASTGGLAPAKYYRFIYTNNSVGSTAIATLYVIFQEE